MGVQQHTLAFFFLHLSQATAMSPLRRLAAGAGGGLVAGGDPPDGDGRDAWLIATDLLPTRRMSHDSSANDRRSGREGWWQNLRGRDRLDLGLVSADYLEGRGFHRHGGLSDEETGRASGRPS